jgi:hypothetical protein
MTTNYLFLFRGGMQGGSPEDMQKQMQKWRNWIGELNAKGVFVGGEPLERTGKVVRGTKKSVTDGPYSEAKDVVGGYVIVKAGSIDAAVELSRGCPIFEVDGTVEVRQLASM